MKKYILLLVLGLCAAAQGADPVTLENRVVRLDIGRAPAPYIERLTHKASGQSVIAGPANKNLFSLLLVKNMPLMVETGVLLDLVVGIFVMGIVINHIQQAFDSQDTHRLAHLRD